MAEINPDRRMDVDSVLKCPRCAGMPTIFRIFRRQHQEVDGTLRPSYENVLWPVRPEILPPQHTEAIRCPDCRTTLVRVAP